MSEYKFKFPLLNGGCSSGLNNAGIETFKNNPISALARECAQNSLDARNSNDVPAKLEFKVHNIDLSTIPGFADLKAVFEQCCQSWDKKSQEYKFSTKALEYFDHGEISILEISDYNTTGLRGQDKEKGSAWHALVMSAGECNKAAENAGGFGIGKSAPFCVSAWRTVFYSSLTPEGQFAFRGVCYNMTHNDADGNETQGIGYYGAVNDNDPNINSIRNRDEIPEFFRRKEPGTSIFALAFDDTGYLEKLRYAVLESFWPAIYFDKICFDIGGEEICKANLAEYMVKYDDLKQLLQSVESADKVYVKEDIPGLGECELYFLLTGGKRQELVCTRSSRMKIQSITTYWKMDGIGFAGLFSCLSTEGNQILKNMEPPEHSKWDWQRSNNTNNPLSEQEQKQILANLKNWVRGKIDAQVKKNYTNEADLEEVGKYFNPADAEPGNHSGDKDEDNHDGFTSKPKIPIVKVLTWKGARPPKVKELVATGGGGEGTAPKIPDPTQNGGGGGRGRKSGGNGGDTPGSKLAGNAQKVKFAAKAFVANCEYVVVFKSEKAFTGKLSLVAAGEDAKEKLTIASARYDQTDLQVSNGEISNLSLSEGEMCKIYVKTQEKDFYSVEVIGNESN